MDKPTIKWVTDTYGLTPNRQGFICCPVHEEKTPSCQLHDDWWYCFGCGASGDSLGLIAAVTHTPVAEVLRRYGDNTPSWRRQARYTKQVDPEALRNAPYTGYRKLLAWFWRELAARLDDAPDWLTERTVDYWSGVFEDEWDHWFVRRHPDYDDTVPVVRREERLKALAALMERGLALERAAAWDRADGEWHLKEAARAAAIRDKGVAV